MARLLPPPLSLSWSWLVVECIHHFHFSIPSSVHCHSLAPQRLTSHQQTP
jgi:hypothetical protein